jgi:hypothetical protein
LCVGRITREEEGEEENHVEMGHNECLTFILIDALWFNYGRKMGTRKSSRMASEWKESGKLVGRKINEF